MKSISAIIVSWNTREYLWNCLNSIRKTNMSCVKEIIVVDNASKDGSPEMVMKEFPEVTLLRSEKNLGFARANNIAIQLAKGNILALVNSDVVVHPGCFEKLAAFLYQHDNVGLIGPRVLGGDGKLQRSCRRLPNVWNTLCRTFALDRIFPFWSVFSGFEIPHSKYDRVMEVEVLSGCFCVARKKAVDEVGGLDERYFFYAEDIDWCKRFREAGWKLMFIPEASATHFGGGSTSNAPLHFSIEILRATLKYWRKHHGIIGQVICYLFTIVHHGLRLMLRSMRTILGLCGSFDSKKKLHEDYVCLRWLLTGKEIS